MTASPPDPAPHAVRVVVADHVGLSRAAIVAVLDASEGTVVVGEAANGAEAIHVTLATHAEVVLMDVRLPLVDGLVAIHQLHEAHDRLGTPPRDRPRVVVLADAGADEYVYEGLLDGARGFVSKDARPDELLATIAVAASDAAVPWPAETVRLVAALTPSRTNRPDVAERRARLSTGDAIVVVGVGRGHSDAEIAGHLGIAVEEVGRRIRGLLDTLQLRDRTQVMVFAYESGLLTPTVAGSGAR